MSGDAIEASGVVRSLHGGDLHSVEVEIGEARRTVLARRAGRLVSRRIRLVVGDRVTVELSPYDPKRGRITERLDANPSARGAS